MNASLRKLTILIGRFSPFHLGHEEVLLRALEKSERVLVILGSANQPRTPKNPWFEDERAASLFTWYASKFPTESKLVVRWVEDHPYSNPSWLAAVHAVVKEVHPGLDDVWITGADRDRSTFYLNEFPTFRQDIVAENREVSLLLSATSIRELYFGNRLNGRDLYDGELKRFLINLLPQTVFDDLMRFRQTPEYESMKRQHAAIEQMKLDYGLGPFMTVDNVVVQSGYILLIKRAGAYGTGLWAMPGGFLELNEWLFDASIRELREETGLKVPEPVLRSSFVADHVFDKPDRSLCGRRISTTHLFKLPDYTGKSGRIILPDVKGQDDAKEAKWFPIDEALQMGRYIFEDHKSIIKIMLAKIGIL